jgi:hypothetical protein
MWWSGLGCNIPPMSTALPRKGLAIASLALGLAGLVTAGGCGVGALAGIAFGVVALSAPRQ